MKDKTIMIYGANGYTGKLLAKHLLTKGIVPILAGRSGTVQALGESLNCPSQVFAIEQAKEYLGGVDILVNLAGPFIHTQKELVEACIDCHTHYMDIAGEVSEIQSLQLYDEAAKAAKVVLLPAAGFGVVPTDIAAKMAVELLEQPTHLTITYATEGGASRGTLKTVLKDIQREGVVLKNGVYQAIRPAVATRDVEVLGKSFQAVYNPWRADLLTAALSTGVKNIETYTSFPSFVVWMMKGRLPWLRNILLHHLLPLLPEGPNEKQLSKGSTYIEVEAKNATGEIAVVKLKGPEAYLFTNYCLENMLQQLSKAEHQGGLLTPSTFEWDWIEELEGVTLEKSKL